MKRKIQEFCAEMTFLLHKVLPKLENAIVWFEPINIYFSLQFIALIDNRFGQVPTALRLLTIFPLVVANPEDSSLPLLLCTVSLILKLLCLGSMLSVPSGTLLPRYLTIGLLLLQEEPLALLDSCIWAHSLYGTFQGFAFGLASVNFVLAAALKVFREIFLVNYTLISEDPAKKIRVPIEYAVKMPLQALLFYFEIGNMPLWESFVCWALIVAVEIRFFVGFVPYTNEKLAQLKLAKLSLLTSYLVSSILAQLDSLFLGNWLVLFLTMTVFFYAVMNRHRASVKYELLCQEIELLERDDQTYIKLDSIYELIKDSDKDSRNLISSLYNVHRKNCKNSDCTCKSKLPCEDFRRVSSTKLLAEQIKLQLKYFLLQLATDNRDKFPQQLNPNLMFISSVSLLNLFPKTFYEMKKCEFKFKFKVGLTETNILSLIRKDAVQLLRDRNSVQVVCEVEKIRKYDQTYESLHQAVYKLCENKLRLWNQINNTVVDLREVQDYCRKQFQLRDNINQLYAKLAKGVINNLMETSKLLLVYTKYIIQDIDQERRVFRQLDKKSQILSLTMLNNIVESNNCHTLLSNQNTFLLRVSTDQNNLGDITWHSRNAPTVLSHKDHDTKIIGYNISLMIPKPFQDEHVKRMERWINHPSSRRFNHLETVFIENFVGECYKAIIYLKILPVETGYELFAMLHKLNCDNYIIVDDYFQVISKMPFLSDMKQLGDIESINLGLLSPQILQILEDPAKLDSLKNTKTTIKIDIPLISAYPRILAQYTNQIKSQKNMPMSQRASLLRRYHSKLIQSDYQHQYQLQIQTQLFNFGRGNQIIFRYISHHLKSLEDQRDVWVKIISKYMETIKESLAADEQSEEQVRSLVASQLSETSTTRLATRLRRKKQAIILRTTKRGVLVCLFLLGVCSVMRVSVQGISKVEREDAFRARIEMEKRMEMSGILINKIVLGGYYKQVNPDWYNTLMKQCQDLQHTLSNLLKQDHLSISNPSGYLIDYKYLFADTQIPLMLNNQSTMSSPARFIQQLLAVSRSLCESPSTLDDFNKQYHSLLMNYGTILRFLMECWEVTRGKLMVWDQLVFYSTVGLLPAAVVCAFVMIGLISYYSKSKSQEENSMLAQFTKIPIYYADKYERYYETCLSNFDKTEDFQNFLQQCQNNEQGADLITVSVPKSNTHSIYWQRLLCLFILLVAWDSVATTKILLSKEPCHKTIDVSYSLTLAKIRMQRDLFDFKAFNRNPQNTPQYQAFLDRLNTPTGLIKLTDSILEYSKEFHPQTYDSFKWSLISDICSPSPITSKHLPCPSILSSGLILSSNYIQRTLSSYSSSPLLLPSILPTATYFSLQQSLLYQYSRFQSIQSSLFSEFSFIHGDTLRWSWIMLAASCGQLIIAVAVLAWKYARERSHYHYFYQYLLIIPVVHLNDNAAIRAYVDKMGAEAEEQGD